MLKKLLKIGIPVLLVALYYTALISHLWINDPGIAATAGTQLVRDGYPYFMQARPVSELPDGNYTLYRNSPVTIIVIHHGYGPYREFMYAVQQEVNSQFKGRAAGEEFTMLNGRIATPPEGPTIRAA